MEQTALALIIFTNFFLVIILGVLVFLVYRLFQQKLPTEKTPVNPEISEKYHPGIVERMKELSTVKPKRSDLFCPNHTEEPGETTCAICDKLFCKACIRPYKSLHFCKEHLPLIMRHEWDEVVTIKISTTDPEKGVKLYDVKKILLEKEDLPSYIETHYKINVDQDYIETYLVLFSIRENVATIRKKLEELT